MDSWYFKSARVERYQRENPSFSSSLLDSIYRSLDNESNGHEAIVEELLVLHRETMKKKHGNAKNSSTAMETDDEDAPNLRRACLIDKWMEKTTEKVVVRKISSSADFDKRRQNTRCDSMLLNSSSSSSSSDSSYGSGLFSSSEAESIYGGVSSKSSSYTTTTWPKPIRTSLLSSSSARPEKFQYNHEQQIKTKLEGGFLKNKPSNALKTCTGGDLKKVKNKPISPGGRIASFINSLFTAGNVKNLKKIKTSKSADHSSTCSSASSFSRSCLSRTPLSSSSSSRRGNLSNGGTKRSVRFYPVSVIVNEDCQPCGHKTLHQEEELSSFHIREKKCRRVEEEEEEAAAARDLLKNCQRKVVECSEQVDDEEEDDDGASDASSDLFELDNLSAIGMDQRYHQELPVYETTFLDTNRAIANGLIM